MSKPKKAKLPKTIHVVFSLTSLEDIDSNGADATYVTKKHAREINTEYEIAGTYALVEELKPKKSK